MLVEPHDYFAGRICGITFIALTRPESRLLRAYLSVSKMIKYFILSPERITFINSSWSSSQTFHHDDVEHANPLRIYYGEINPPIARVWLKYIIVGCKIHKNLFQITYVPQLTRRNHRDIVNNIRHMTFEPADVFGSKLIITVSAFLPWNIPRCEWATCAAAAGRSFSLSSTWYNRIQS